MGLFRKSQEEKALEERLKSADRFPGSLAEYNALKNDEHVIMDTERPEKYVFVDQYRDGELLEKLLNLGCIGFIRYVREENNITCGYGIPVRRKMDKDYEHFSVPLD